MLDAWPALCRCPHLDLRAARLPCEGLARLARADFGAVAGAGAERRAARAGSRARLRERPTRVALARAVLPGPLREPRRRRRRRPCVLGGSPLGRHAAAQGAALLGQPLPVRGQCGHLVRPHNFHSKGVHALPLCRAGAGCAGASQCLDDASRPGDLSGELCLVGRDAAGCRRAGPGCAGWLVCACHAGGLGVPAVHAPRLAGAAQQAGARERSLELAAVASQPPEGGTHPLGPGPAGALVRNRHGLPELHRAVAKQPAVGMAALARRAAQSSCCIPGCVRACRLPRHAAGTCHDAAAGRGEGGPAAAARPACRPPGGRRSILQDGRRPRSASHGGHLHGGAGALARRALGVRPVRAPAGADGGGAEHRGAALQLRERGRRGGGPLHAGSLPALLGSLPVRRSGWAVCGGRRHCQRPAASVGTACLGTGPGARCLV
mmetsp:Transcript_112796/g.364146  ORF Transcript_112796/g.364146 Transcript_112796/m.364146 type:complete len:436 (+) Transcript_112796:264-1571(+)